MLPYAHPVFCAEDSSRCFNRDRHFAKGGLNSRVLFCKRRCPDVSIGTEDSDYFSRLVSLLAIVMTANGEKSGQRTTNNRAGANHVIVRCRQYSLNRVFAREERPKQSYQFPFDSSRCFNRDGAPSIPGS
ncbi:hypothetical protein SAMN05444285_104153 [Draconibacterium orientale]|uniref:Uncharacterized protein n=1 Tax=Draconibacterium orientale TaxID=1168034 RepID=A0A1I0B2V4_9BACT|nr:hypothetical protein SAMN05444285_104153 [Draconibacterium orientale]